ncbi:MAG: ABC transporter permease, partial [Vicinamibacterales bacterium]
LLAWLGVETLRAVIPEEVPRAGSIAVDLRVLAITVGLALLSGTLFSLVPILQSRRPVAGTVVTQVMRTNTVNATHQRLRGALVTIEVALAAVLLVGSGLFLSSYVRVASVDLGMELRNVLTVRVRPLVGQANWARAQQRNRGLLQQILDEVRSMHGVEAAAFVHGGVPLRGDLRTMELGIPGRALPPDEDLDYNAISPDYFRTLGVPLLAGRFFSDEDGQGTEPVAVINQAAATRYFPGENPVGRTIHFLGTRRVVGVVGTIRHDGPETDWRRQGFIPLAQSDAVGATLVLRYSRDVGIVLPGVKTAIWSRFPELALPDIQTLDGYLGRLVAQRRFNMLLLSLFGVLAIVIACVGIYGVMAYVVTQRTHEIGIRMALGAGSVAVLWSVLGRATAYITGGLCAGLAGAWLLSALVATFLFQTQPLDPWVYLGVSGTLIATGVAAAYVPARRAARLDPVTALRLE